MVICLISMRSKSPSKMDLSRLHLIVKHWQDYKLDYKSMFFSFSSGKHDVIIIYILFYYLLLHVKSAIKI